MDCKFSARLWIAIAMSMAMLQPVAALDWRIRADEVLLGGVRIEQFEIDRASGELRIGPVQLADGTALGSFQLSCAPAAIPTCHRASLAWKVPNLPPLEFALQMDPGQLTLDGTAMQLRLERRAQSAPWRVQATWPDLGALPSLLPQLLGLSSLSGALEVRGEIEPAEQSLQVELRDGGLDTTDGLYAAGELGLKLDWDRRGDAISVEIEWSAGEALLGPVYLPEPNQPVHFTLQGRVGADCPLILQSFAIEQPSTLSIRGRGRIDPCHGVEGVDAALVLDRIDLAGAWALGLESLAGAAGWAGVLPQGSITGALELRDGQLRSGSLQLDQAALGDLEERLRIDGLSVDLDWSDAGRAARLQLGWSGAAIHRVPLGPVELVLIGRDDVLRLEQALSIPVLDGRMQIESMQWRDWRSSQRELNLAARLEPIGLAALTRSLGWTEFGGQLSGRIPGLRVIDGVIELDGGLELELFDGRARIGGLSIERPFGALPALAADIEFESLDLALLTGAFEIGSMRGRVSGHLRELRLLDWQPVRFDAWFETLDTGSNRRISQKAVDSLSTLGGGGSAVLSGTLLQMFENFPYRRIGLGCRLERNVCLMRGLEIVDSGGYMIIEGRPFPVLNVVGHRRRVDWPQLVAQLVALIES